MEHPEYMVYTESEGGRPEVRLAQGVKVDLSGNMTLYFEFTKRGEIRLVGSPAIEVRMSGNSLVLSVP